MKSQNANGSKVVRVGLLGLGNVGAGVAEILATHGAMIEARAGVPIRIVKALVRNKRRKRLGAAGNVALTTKASDIVGAPDVDVVVELMGGIEPALSHVTDALAAGQTVVTANKAIVAAHGKKIFQAARKSKRDVHFEAAVAGGIPIIRTLREALASDRITELTGILNGTTNYIVEAMASGQSYESALAVAQDLGYAEADPTLDVNGADAADKLAILIGLAFGASVTRAKLGCIGITELTSEMMMDAAELGYAIKLLARARRVVEGDVETVQAGVFPYLVPLGHALSAVPDAQNAIYVQSDSLGTTLYQGPGAGGLPTGSAVVADLIEAARNVAANTRGRSSAVQPNRSGPKLAKAGDSVCPWYLRLTVAEKPGVLAAITKLLADESISLATVSQMQPSGDGHEVAIVLTTHPTSAGAMERALKKMHRLKVVRGEAQVLRVYAE
ncbi:MAG: homoserine dehydrogenase [Deltaproteobacteria bacterium]|jgi:homoserine dehydrogenase|nr:homoserine dehydrogenase [Deltaproteobacteria bacterium]